MIDRTGELSIRITGFKGNLPLSPENYDIKELQTLLPYIEDILYPINKKDRPLITYHLNEGSIINQFKTGIQAIIAINAVFGHIIKERSIDFLDLKSATAIEFIQNLSYEKNYTFSLATSLKGSVQLDITPETKFIRSENIWVDAEFYFYGILTNAGGKNKANIHIESKEYGQLVVNTPKSFLENLEQNFLYKEFGVRAKGKQNLSTGEIDKRTLSFIELIDHSPVYDETYIKGLIKKAKQSWKGINTNEWLENLRGDFERFPRYIKALPEALEGNYI